MTNEEKIKQIDDYKKKVKDLDVEALKKLEQEVIKEAESIDDETSSLEFDMPKENYKEVAEGIRMILDKKTVEWRFTLGMVSMYDFWNPTERQSKITYPMLDSTLRTIGEMRFTGYTEWAAVVAINKYMEGLREKYVDTTEKIYDVAAKHNVILDELKLKDPNFANEMSDSFILYNEYDDMLYTNDVLKINYVLINKKATQRVAFVVYE